MKSATKTEQPVTLEHTSTHPNLLDKQHYDSHYPIRNLHEYSVFIARTIEEIEKIREGWQNLRPYPTANIDYFLTELKTHSEIVRPYVLTIRNNGRLIAMLVGRIEDKQIEFKVGYKPLFNPKVRVLNIIEGGIIGDTSFEVCALYMSYLQKALQLQEADLVSFSDIPTDSYLYWLGTTQTGLISKDYEPHPNIQYRMTIPASLEDFYSLRKNKKNLRKRVRKLEKDFSGRVAIKCYKTPQDVNQLCQDLEKVSSKTFKKATGDAFVNDAKTRNYLTLLAENGHLLAYVLYIDDKPIAFEGILKYKDVYFSHECGYDPDYETYRPGTYLMLKVIDQLSNDDQIQFMDWAAGDYEYKSRFCDLNWNVASFYIFQPSLRGIKLNAMKLFCGASHRFGTNLLTTFKLKDKWEKFKRIQFTKQIGPTLGIFFYDTPFFEINQIWLDVIQISS
ncbi:MAG: GNAT family N-acetyltransferase [Anaerolineae bacterium]|nr:GNAT family N-acetyltransferase [Anaerolineae bacterium]